MKRIIVYIVVIAFAMQSSGITSKLSSMGLKLSAKHTLRPMAYSIGQGQDPSFFEDKATVRAWLKSEKSPFAQQFYQLFLKNRKAPNHLEALKELVYDVDISIRVKAVFVLGFLCTNNHYYPDTKASLSSEVFFEALTARKDGINDLIHSFLARFDLLMQDFDIDVLDENSLYIWALQYIGSMTELPEIFFIRLAEFLAKHRKDSPFDLSYVTVASKMIIPDLSPETQRLYMRVLQDFDDEGKAHLLGNTIEPISKTQKIDPRLLKNIMQGLPPNSDMGTTTIEAVEAVLKIIVNQAGLGVADNDYINYLIDIISNQDDPNLVDVASCYIGNIAGSYKDQGRTEALSGIVSTVISKYQTEPKHRKAKWAIALVEIGAYANLPTDTIRALRKQQVRLSAVRKKVLSAEPYTAFFLKELPATPKQEALLLNILNGNGSELSLSIITQTGYPDKPFFVLRKGNYHTTLVSGNAVLGLHTHPPMKGKEGESIEVVASQADTQQSAMKKNEASYIWARDRMWCLEKAGFGEVDLKTDSLLFVHEGGETLTFSRYTDTKSQEALLARFFAKGGRFSIYFKYWQEGTYKTTYEPGLTIRTAYKRAIQVNEPAKASSSGRIPPKVLLNMLLDGELSADFWERQFSSIEARELLRLIFEKARLSETELDIVLSSYVLGEKDTEIKEHIPRKQLTDYHRSLLRGNDTGTISANRVNGIKHAALRKLRKAFITMLLDHRFNGEAPGIISPETIAYFKSSPALSGKASSAGNEPLPFQAALSRVNSLIASHETNPSSFEPMFNPGGEKLTAKEALLANTCIRDIGRSNRVQFAGTDYQLQVLSQLRSMGAIMGDSLLILGTLRLAVVADLIIGSHPDLVAIGRQAVVEDFISSDSRFGMMYGAYLTNAEMGAYDSRGPYCFLLDDKFNAGDFDQFLASITFEDGYEALKGLNENELYYLMIILYNQWQKSGKSLDEVRFDNISPHMLKRAMVQVANNMAESKAGSGPAAKKPKLPIQLTNSGTAITISIRAEKTADIKVLFFIASTGVPEVRARYPVGVLSLASAIRSREFLARVTESITGEKFLGDINGFPVVEVDIIDMGLVASDFDIEAAIAEYGPDIVGVSATSASIDNAYEIADASAKACPETVRIIGGIHATALPEETLNNGQFQIVFLGEAEESFSEYILQTGSGDTPDLPAIKGIYYKGADGQLNTTGFRQPVIDLKEYPSIVLSYDNAVQFQGSGNARLNMARGCPYNCPFCARGIMRTGVRYREPSDVVEDMKSLHDKGFRFFYFIDDTFTLNRANMVEFLDYLEKAALDNIAWEFQTRIDKLLDKDGEPAVELMKRMKALGCMEIQLGVETADNTLGKDIKPGGSEGNRISVTRALNETGIKVMYNLMVGLPNQTWASVTRSMQSLYKQEVYFGAHFDVAGTGFCVPFPGSPIHKEGSVRVVRQGDRKWNYPVFASPELFNFAGQVTWAEYGIEVPDLLPVETDAMITAEISEAYVYYSRLINAMGGSENQEELLSRIGLLWKDLATRLAIDIIANASDAPSVLTRNQRVAELRKRMLRGNFPENFPGNDMSTFIDMLLNMSVQIGYEQLSRMDHDQLYRFLRALYSFWMTTEQGFNKIDIAASTEKQLIKAGDAPVKIDGFNLSLDHNTKTLSVSQASGNSFKPCSAGEVIINSVPQALAGNLAEQLDEELIRNNLIIAKHTGFFVPPMPISVASCGDLSKVISFKQDNITVIFFSDKYEPASGYFSIMEGDTIVGHGVTDLRGAQVQFKFQIHYFHRRRGIGANALGPIIALLNRCYSDNPDFKVKQFVFSEIPSRSLPEVALRTGLVKVLTDTGFRAEGDINDLTKCRFILDIKQAKSSSAGIGQQDDRKWKAFERMKSHFVHEGFTIEELKYLMENYIMGHGEALKAAADLARQAGFGNPLITIPSDYFYGTEDHTYTYLEAIKTVITEIAKNTYHIDPNDDAFIGIRLNEEYGDLEIVYYDNGNGDPEAQRRFGERYTSTGKPDRGYDLRLIKYIVENIGGEIRFHSNSKLGTYIVIGLSIPGVTQRQPLGIVSRKYGVPLRTRNFEMQIASAA